MEVPSKDVISDTGKLYNCFNNDSSDVIIADNNVKEATLSSDTDSDIALIPFMTDTTDTPHSEAIFVNEYVRYSRKGFHNHRTLNYDISISKAKEVHSDVSYRTSNIVADIHAPVKDQGAATTDCQVSSNCQVSTVICP